MKKALVSIAIPTYNGESSLPDTVDLIVSQVKLIKNKSLFELSITDDCSSDNTKNYLTKIAKKYPFINCYYNKKNLGMDKNFLQAGINASGEYVWFFGQDDLLKKNAVNKVIQILNSNNLGQLYINYEQFSEKKQLIVSNSVIRSRLKKPLKKSLNIFNSGHEYFSSLDDAPSFLPATIMKRKYLLDKRLQKFYGTHYIQYAAFVLNLNNEPTGVIEDVLIKGIIPIKGWQTNGSKLFEIAVGKLYAQYLANKIDNLCLSNKILFEKKIKFLKRWPKLLTLSTYLDLIPKQKSFKILNKIYPQPIAILLISSTKFFVFIKNFIKKSF